ncbi:DNA primase [Altericroceibacterium xinjiangense]|uniref:DNA primase n=1 Tax=Altericroceibacterium xinjiangense TaxID=762261 RepID=UPI000F7DAFED|nr:DNA primase [Altericroceibacterium xinjiangense]
MTLSPQWLDELRARVALSGVIGRTTKLQKAGHEWKACCPFHNENTPSFTVSDQKGFYHCFGCGAHGDVIRWMTDQRGLSFMDAVKELAGEAGLEMPAPDPREARQAERRATLHDVTAAAQDWFQGNLLSNAGARARDYLKSRGFNDRTQERFGFGFAPDDRQALTRALARFDMPMLIDAGLLIEVEGRDPYARFRGRLMLPIRDARGRVIAFGGRILETGKTDAPKYLNSPDTPLFDKGRTLYNLDRAGPISRRSGRVVAVEGYMDVIALAAAGIEDAVAPLGTALTERQIELLWRLVERPLLCFDGDAAGQRASFRAATRALPLLRPGHSLGFVTLPEGLDPDDLVKRDGAEAMERLLGEPRSLLDTLWEHERDAAPLGTPEEKAGLKARLLAHVEDIQDQDIKALYRRELLERFSAFAFPRRESPRKDGGKWIKGAGGRRGSWTPERPTLSPEAAGQLKRAAAGGSRDKLAQAVLAGLARYPREIAWHAEALARLAPVDPAIAAGLDRLLAFADTLEAGPTPPISGLKDYFPLPDRAHYSFLTEGADPLTAREDLAEAVAVLVERPALDAAIAKATARFADDPDGSWVEQQRLRKRKLEIESRLGQMARKRAAEAAHKEQIEASSDKAPGEQE